MAARESLPRMRRWVPSLGREHARQRRRPRDRIRPRGCRSDMQAALEVTARHCRKEAEQYGQCVAAHPSSWQQDCHQLKLEMAKCTSSHTKKGDLLCVNSGVSTGLKVPGSRNGNNIILKIY